MKPILPLLLCSLLLTGCVYTTRPPEGSIPTKPMATQPTELVTEAATDSTSVTFPLFYGNENADGFHTKEVTIHQRDPQMVVEKLIEAGVLPDGTTLLSHEIDGTCLRLDFNTPFRDHLNTMGTAGERMMMGSVVNTFLSVFNAESVFITTNGEILESGHVVYDFELTFFQ